MSFPIQVTFRDMGSSDAVEAYIRDRAQKLDTFSSRITNCRVAIHSPHRHHQTGRHYRVRVDLVVPGGEIVVSHAPDEDPSNTDAYSAIDEAFERLSRRLEDYVRRQRGDVKPHDKHYREGRVAKLWTYEGYGFLRTSEGGEVYFHRNSVLDHAFDRMKVGSQVRFL